MAWYVWSQCLVQLPPGDPIDQAFGHRVHSLTDEALGQVTDAVSEGIRHVLPRGKGRLKSLIH